MLTVYCISLLQYIKIIYNIFCSKVPLLIRTCTCIQNITTTTYMGFKLGLFCGVICQYEYVT